MLPRRSLEDRIFDYTSFVFSTLTSFSCAIIGINATKAYLSQIGSIKLDYPRRLDIFGGAKRSRIFHDDSILSLLI